MGAQMLQLSDHILFGEDVHAFAFARAVAVLLHHGFGHFSMTQPGFDRGHFFQTVRVKHSAHGAAVGMPANDDVVYPQSLEKMPTVKAWLRHAEVAKTMVQDNCNCANESESMHILTEENVIAQLQHLRTHPSVASRMANGQLFIHGWVYNIETSEIKAYDADQGCFLPLNGSLPIPVATPKARF